MELDKSNPKLKEILEHTTSDNNDEAIAKVRVKIIGKDIDGKEVSEEYRYIDKDYFNSINPEQDILKIIAFDKTKKRYYFVEPLIIDSSEDNFNSTMELLEETLEPLDLNRYSIIPSEENSSILAKHDVNIGHDKLSIPLFIKITTGVFFLCFSGIAFFLSFCGGMMFIMSGNNKPADLIFYIPIALFIILLPIILSIFLFIPRSKEKELFLISIINSNGSLKESFFKQSQNSIFTTTGKLKKILKK